MDTGTDTGTVPARARRTDREGGPEACAPSGMDTDRDGPLPPVVEP